MKVEERVWKNGGWVSDRSDVIEPERVNLVLLFGEIDAIASQTGRAELRELYPNARIVGASSAGTIESGELSENPLVATAVAFERSRVEVAMVEELKNATLEESARSLIGALPQEGLRHVFVLMEGLAGLNASHLVRGINALAAPYSVSGGLAGEGWQFKRTLVFADGEPRERAAVAVGFYGEGLHVRIGCRSGWEEFGAERVVTRSEGHIVYEIDHKPAIKLYEDYLGEYIRSLPESGLRFPLNVRERPGENEVARVIMGINPDGSLVYGGDIPQGSTVRLMKTNVTNLIEGAERVASSIAASNDQRALAIAVSCSARRSVLKQMADAEIAAVAEHLAGPTRLCGFYSYGEIAPFPDYPLRCHLHNQTMTLTVLYEDADA